jgi:hypothetical protein
MKEEEEEEASAVLSVKSTTLLLLQRNWYSRISAELVSSIESHKHEGLDNI